ncbi:MAG: MFS transporter [Acholeplasmataceae bacterium]|nr:MFS transporter [Acholeplasmataceae bacterium]
MKSLAIKMNKKIYYGWVIVIVSAFALFFSSPGQTYSISVFNSYYETQLGYSKTLLSTGYSIATTISGLLIVLIGRAIDKHGQKKMFIIVGVGLALTALFSSFVLNIWMIYISFFFLRFLGQGSMTLIPASLVPQWFTKKRAFALSMMTFGGFFATLLVPAFNLWMINTLNWQNAWRIWALLLLVVFVPMVFFLVINRPEDADISMENEKTYISKEDALEALNNESWTLKEAMKTKDFWFIGFSSMIVPMFTTGFVFHFFSIMDLRNISHESAAWIIGFMAFPMLFMPFAAKLFIDRTKPKYIFFITQIMVLISMLILLLWVDSVSSAIIFILIYGLGAAIQSVTLNTIYPFYYGRKYLGSIRGMATVFMVIGSALGPLQFAISFEQFGTFNYAILIMMVMTTIAGLLSLLIRKPDKKIIV